MFNIRVFRIGWLLVVLLVTLLLFSAEVAGGFGPSAKQPHDTTGSPKRLAPDVIPNLSMYGVTINNTLVHFQSATPGTILGATPMTGLQASENIMGIDFRPATGQLFGLGSTSRLYTINLATGVATQVGTGTFSTPLSGTEFGFDFSPVADRIRVVSDAGQNMRLNPLTGDVAAVDSLIAFASTDIYSMTTPALVASAYLSNTAGTATTTLFGYEYFHDVLVTQGGAGGIPSANGGQLFTVGPSGVITCNRKVGLDIAASGHAFASASTGPCTTSGLYLVNLTTGGFTLIGTIGGGVIIQDIAIGPPSKLYLPLIVK